MEPYTVIASIIAIDQLGERYGRFLTALPLPGIGLNLVISGGHVEPLIYS